MKFQKGDTIVARRSGKRFRIVEEREYLFIIEELDYKFWRDPVSHSIFKETASQVYRRPAYWEMLEQKPDTRSDVIVFSLIALMTIASCIVAVFSA